MDRAYLTFLWILQDITIFIALVVFLITTRAGRKKFEWIGIILGASLLVEILGHIGYWVFRVNMNFLSMIFEFVIVALYYIFYSQKISSSKALLTMKLLLAGFVVFHLTSVIIKGPHNTHDITGALRSMILVIYSLMFFYNLMKDLPTQLVTRLPMFWINASVLLYYSTILIISILAEYIVNVLKGDIILTWMVHNFMGVVHYSMIAIGLWSNRSLYSPRSSQ